MRKLLLLAFWCASTIMYADDNVKRPDSYNYNRGVEEMNNGNLEEAINYFNKEISDNPKNGYAYAWIGTIYASQGENGRALTAIDKALKLVPKKDSKFLSGSYSVRAKVYCELGDTVKALGDYSTAIKVAPSETDCYEKRAQIYYEQGKYELADNDYQSIKKLDQGNVMSYMGIGRNRIAQKRWDEAIEQFNYVQNLYSDYSSAYSFRAEAYIGKEKWAEATDDLIKALSIDGDNKAFFLMQDLKEPALGMMVAKLKIQSAKNANSSYYPYCTGVLYETNKDYEKALTSYQEAKKREVDAVTLRRISQCFFQLGDYEDALDAINQAIELDTANYELMPHKAIVLVYSGKSDLAIKEWDGLIAQFPDKAEYYYRRAGVKTLSGDFGGAIEDYTMAITLYSKFPYALVLRGDLYERQGKHDLAKFDYQQVIDIETELGDVDRSPYALLALGNADKAIAVMDSIIASDKDNAGHYYDAACLYSRMKNKEKAVEYLRLALEKGYDDVAYIQRDYDMDFLRNTEEYRSLIEKYKKVSHSKARVEQPKREEAVSEIPFTKENGVCNVKCKINDLPLYFIFDTGASTVSLSMVEASFMMKNGYLTNKDVVGSSAFVDANGNVSEGTVINLKKVKFGELELDNVRASVVKNQKAPLLLGQTVLSRAGKIEIDNDKKVIRVKYMK